MSFLTKSIRYASLVFVLAISFVAATTSGAKADPLPVGHVTITSLSLFGALPDPMFSLSVQVPLGESVRFSCQLDDGAWNKCAFPISPYCQPGIDYSTCTLSGQSFITPPNGPHILRAKAARCTAACENEANWTDGPIAEHAFMVDSIDPVITVLSGPTIAKPALTSRPTFVFSSTDPGRIYCMVVQLHIQNCASPLTLPVLKNGLHNITFFQEDALNNSGATNVQFAVDVFYPAKCVKGRSKKQKAKRAKCVKKNAAAKTKWKKNPT